MLTLFSYMNSGKTPEQISYPCSIQFYWNSRVKTLFPTTEDNELDLAEGWCCRCRRCWCCRSWPGRPPGAGAEVLWLWPPVSPGQLGWEVREKHPASQQNISMFNVNILPNNLWMTAKCWNSILKRSPKFSAKVGFKLTTWELLLGLCWRAQYTTRWTWWTAWWVGEGTGSSQSRSRELFPTLRIKMTSKTIPDSRTSNRKLIRKVLKCKKFYQKFFWMWRPFLVFCFAMQRLVRVEFEYIS